MARLDYNQAFKLYTEANAEIKCTYADIYSREKDKVFSLQASGFGSHYIGKAKFSEAVLNKDKKSLVPITLSEEAKQVITVYVNSVLKHDKYVHLAAAHLLQHFSVKQIGKRNVYTMIDPVFYVRPEACAWTPTNVDVDAIVTRDENGNIVEDVTVKTRLPKKTKLALAAAALLAFVNS